MQVATGKSILNGIAIGKIKIYKAPKHEIPMELVTDVQAELDRFEDAVQKVIDQQAAVRILQYYLDSHKNEAS